MPPITYDVVVPFLRDEEDLVVQGEAQEAATAETARRRARAMIGSKFVGTLAFTRTGDTTKAIEAWMDVRSGLTGLAPVLDAKIEFAERLREFRGTGKKSGGAK